MTQKVPNSPHIIGLTGNIATGKSTVSNYLISKNDFHIIDLDKIVKEISQKPNIKKIITKLFQTNNSQEISSIIFQKTPESQKLKTKLEQLLHPLAILEVKKEIERIITDPKNTNQKTIIIDAPLLIESGLDEICNQILILTASLQNQIQRITQSKPQLNQEQIENIINSQTSLAERLFILSQKKFPSKNIFTIINNSTSAVLYDQINLFITQKSF